MDRSQLGFKVIAGVFCCAVSALIFGTMPARADDDPSVARISLLSGTVSVQRADSGDTIAAALNAPISVGDYVSTSDGSRAELQLDSANVVRLGPDAQVRFTNLGAPANLMQLAQGTVELRSFALTNGRPQVQTPSATIQPETEGRYRVDVTSDGATVLAVRSGIADVVAPQGTQKIGAGTTVQITGTSSAPQISPVQNVALDGFDSWNTQRDDYVQSGANAPYANSGIVGLSDLNAYGRWVNYPSYGQVWVANSYPAGWAPYRYGRWVWQPYYGWTWVGFEPWGWAPYHYGRWFYAQNVGWAWYPGPVYVRPVWRPAYVAFFGFGGGGGFSFNLSFGNVGWVPLAPYEAYHPWWGPGFANRTTVVNNVTNITNITNITNVNITKVYHNASAPGGVAVVSHENFTNGGAYHYVPVREDQLHNVALVKSVLPVVPTKQNLSYTKWDTGHVSNATPISSQFKALPAPVKAPPTFVQERSTIQTATAHVNPALTPPQTNGATLNSTTAHTTTGSPWDRFNTSTGTSTTGQPGVPTSGRTYKVNTFKGTPGTSTGNTGTLNATNAYPGGANGSKGNVGHGSSKGGSKGHTTTKTTTKHVQKPNPPPPAGGNNSGH